MEIDIIAEGFRKNYILCDIRQRLKILFYFIYLIKSKDISIHSIYAINGKNFYVCYLKTNIL